MHFLLKMFFCNLLFLVAVTSMSVEQANGDHGDHSGSNPILVIKNDVTCDDTNNRKNILGDSNICLASSLNEESTLGNFVTDAMVHAYKNESHLAIMPSKTITFNISEVLLRLDHIRKVFGKSVAILLVNITGEELRHIFEQSVRNHDVVGKDTVGEFLQVSGMKLEYDLTQPTGQRLVSACFNPEKCKKKIIFKSTATYRVVVTQDLYTKAVKENNKDMVSSIIEFIKAFPNKTIPSSIYKKRQCRTYLMTKYYKDRMYLMNFLLLIMVLSGLLTIISNSSVIYFHKSKMQSRECKKPILSLACIDLVAGFICTPSICLIYYYSKCQLTKHLFTSEVFKIKLDQLKFKI